MRHARPFLLSASLFRAALIAAALLHAPVRAQDDNSDQQKEILERLNALEKTLAETSLRIGRIEENVRKMNGSVEEAQYLARQTQKKFQNLKSDVELRLRDQEDKIASKNPAAAESQTPTEREIPSDPDDLFEYAVQLLLDKRNFREAAKAISIFLERFPDHPRAGEALYWLGELHYSQGEFKNAADAYLEGYSSYGEGKRAPDSLLKLGISLGELGQKEQACTTLRSLSQRFPEAPPRIKNRARLEVQKAKCEQ